MFPFHIALPSEDLSSARIFYGEVLGARETRSAPGWVDFDFFGHQLSLHLVSDRRSSSSVPRKGRAADVQPLEKLPSQLIDGDPVPTRHFGMILDRENWEALRDRLNSSGQQFVLGPKLRFAGREGEQWTMFVRDPSGNALEFKYFTDTSRGLWY